MGRFVIFGPKSWYLEILAGNRNRGNLCFELFSSVRAIWARKTSAFILFGNHSDLATLTGRLGEAAFYNEGKIAGFLIIIGVGLLMLKLTFIRVFALHFSLFFLYFLTVSCLESSNYNKAIFSIIICDEITLKYGDMKKRTSERLK